MSILDLFRLDGQAAIVTGASRGLGASMAVALEEAGARVVVFLASPAAAYVHGTTLTVDGGWLAR